MDETCPLCTGGGGRHRRPLERHGEPRDGRAARVLVPQQRLADVPLHSDLRGHAQAAARRVLENRAVVLERGAAHHLQHLLRPRPGRGGRGGGRGGGGRVQEIRQGVARGRRGRGRGPADGRPPKEVVEEAAAGRRGGALLRGRGIREIE